MNPVIDTLKVDLRSKKYQSINVKQYDENSRIVKVMLFDNNVPYSIPTNVDIIFRCTKSDHTYVTDFIPNENISGNTITITIPVSALTQSGEVICDIGIYKKTDTVVGKQVLSSQLFYLYVERAAYDEKAMCSSSEYSVLIKLMDDIEKAIEQFKQLVAENEFNLENKVDKETGKGLSSNNYTDEEKDKLTNIQAEANKYIHPNTHPATMIVEDANHRFVTDLEKATYLDKYTKNEIDNQFAAHENNVDWKESVDTYADILTTYPNPQDGWTVNVKDTDYTYRYSGTSWVTISVNAIPKATTSVDGLMTTTYVQKLQGIETEAQKNVIEEIKVNGVIQNPTNKSIDLTITHPISLPANGGDADTINGYTVESNVPANAKFTDTTYSLVTLSQDGLMSKEDKKKLDEMEEKANHYIHPDTHSADMIEENKNRRFISDDEKASFADKYTKKEMDHTLDKMQASIEGFGTSSGMEQIQCTYAELKGKKENHLLIAGTQYLLTDYQTKYRQPYTNVIKTAETVERLVLTATATNKFHPIVASIDYPKDVIYYDFDEDVCEDDSTPRNGFIQRRIDTQYEIDIPQDWRTILWARFKATAQTWTSGAVNWRSMYQSGANLYMSTREGTPTSATDSNYFQLICTVNDYFWTAGITYTGLTYNMITYAERYTFNADVNLTKIEPTKSNTIIPEKMFIKGAGMKNYPASLKGLHNNVFCFSTESNKSEYNSFGLGCYNNTFHANCYSNVFDSDCHDNTFGSGCHKNTFGSRCHSNVFGSNGYGNVFGSNCYGNVFSTGCCNNNFDSECYSNIFGSAGQENTFASNCRGNTFGVGCYNNVFSSTCAHNVFSSDCCYNMFGPYSYSNTVASKFQCNTLEARIYEKDMSKISELHGKAYNHRIFKNSAGIVYAVHYVGTTPTYTMIT